MGWILIILAVPLLIGYGLSDKKNPMWLRLGVAMAGIGFLIQLLTSVLS
jgi:hypothetical protein